MKVSGLLFFCFKLALLNTKHSIYGILKKTNLCKIKGRIFIYEDKAK